MEFAVPIFSEGFSLHCFHSKLIWPTSDLACLFNKPINMLIFEIVTFVLFHNFTVSRKNTFRLETLFVGLLWHITRHYCHQSPISFSSLLLQSVSYRAQVSSAEKLRLSALGGNTRKNKIEKL